MSDKDLIIEIKKIESETHGPILGCHWHEQIQFFYFTQGSAIVRCNSKKYEVGAHDLVIINSKELHYIENIGESLTCYMIKIDLSFIYSNRVDSIQAQFLTPLSQNLILFENVVRDDKDILLCVNRMIDEYFKKQIGFELAIKAQVYDLIVLLLRGYVKKIYTANELGSQLANFQRFKNVISYIDSNFTEKIDLDRLTDITKMSQGHFCRLFKQITGMSAINYINNLRINKAVELIRISDQNMTEIAMNCGFSDSNYFSRVFKKHEMMSPLQLRKLSKKR
jgi:AraC-like DNA-binding protein